jgi:hypothetical protein
MRKVIPQKTEIYCDRCKAPVGRSGLWVRGDETALGYMGEYQSNSVREYQSNSVSFDLCGKCREDFYKFLKNIT